MNRRQRVAFARRARERPRLDVDPFVMHERPSTAQADALNQIDDIVKNRGNWFHLAIHEVIGVVTERALRLEIIRVNDCGEV